MPFRPELFLDLARELAQQPATEARLRTAVSRAYYAAFLTARDRLRIQGEGHQPVLHAARTVHRPTGEKLSALFRFRILADYDLHPADPTRQDWEANWRTVNTLAGNVMPLVAALGPRQAPPRGA